MFSKSTYETAVALNVLLYSAVNGYVKPLSVKRTYFIDIFNTIGKTEKVHFHSLLLYFFFIIEAKRRGHECSMSEFHRI